VSNTSSFEGAGGGATSASFFAVVSGFVVEFNYHKMANATIKKVIRQ